MADMQGLPSDNQAPYSCELMKTEVLNDNEVDKDTMFCATPLTSHQYSQHQQARKRPATDNCFGIEPKREPVLPPSTAQMRNEQPHTLQTTEEINFMNLRHFNSHMANYQHVINNQQQMPTQDVSGELSDMVFPPPFNVIPDGSPDSGISVSFGLPNETQSPVATEGEDEGDSDSDSSVDAALTQAIFHEKFDEVPGRLCLLSQSTKYKVTMGEVVRRISYPETLHASLINGILRKGKAKNNGKRLREQLEEKGVRLPMGRRKTAATTAFTALCEEEAVRMGRDFRELCQRSGGADYVARQLTSEVAGSGDHALLMKKAQLQSTSYVLEELRDVLIRIPDEPSNARYHTEADLALTQFSLLTHGFGNIALKGMLDWMRLYVHESLKTIDSLSMMSSMSMQELMTEVVTTPESI